MTASGQGSRGLAAVARVRSLRERDSLVGLQQARVTAGRDRDRLSSLETRLDAPSGAALPVPGTAAGPPTLSVDTFLDVRRSLLALGAAVTSARGRFESTDAVAVAAFGRWQQDRTRLEAIGLLQDRRAAEARAEQRREEARDLDEVSGQLWVRRRDGDGVER